MKVAFDQLPDQSRLWVYQANRPFSKEQIETIHHTMDLFIDSWEAHGKPLSAGYDIRYDQFIILAVDESVHGATGCSIDGSVALVRQLEQNLGMSLLDRSQVAVETSDGLQLIPFNKVKIKIEEGVISSEDMVFNNAVSTLRQFKDEWRLAAGSSWMKRHFKVAH